MTQAIEAPDAADMARIDQLFETIRVTNYPDAQVLNP